MLSEALKEAPQVIVEPYRWKARDWNARLDWGSLKDVKESLPRLLLDRLPPVATPDTGAQACGHLLIRSVLL